MFLDDDCLWGEITGPRPDLDGPAVSEGGLFSLSSFVRVGRNCGVMGGVRDGDGFEVRLAMLAGGGGVFHGEPGARESCGVDEELADGCADRQLAESVALGSGRVGSVTPASFLAGPGLTAASAIIDFMSTLLT